MSAVAFDYEDVIPKVQRAVVGATREDAEDAVQLATAELLEAGEPLKTAYVVRRGKFRLIDAKRRREARNVSLDAFRESSADSAPVELAIEEVNFEAHATLAESRRNPILATKIERVERGSAAHMRRTGAANNLTRWPDSVVAQARKLKETGLSYREVSEATGVPQGTVIRWCRGASRRVPSGGGWSRETILAAFAAFAREEGRRPSVRDVETDPRLPGPLAIYHNCGTYAITMVAAEAGIDG